MKFNLKFKILTSIAVLLVTCTAFSLGYSYNLFTEDKTSYIYETCLKKSETIADQINFKISELSNRLDFNSLLVENPSVDPEKLINTQADMIMFGTLDLKESRLTPGKLFTNLKNINYLSSSLGISSNEIAKHVLDNSNKAPLSTDKLSYIYNPKPNAYFLVLLSKKSINSIFYAVSNITPMFEMITKDRTFNNKIINLNNEIDKKTNASWINELSFNQNKKGVFSKTINNKSYLVGFVFVNSGTLVLSSIDKATAFNITYFLILKTALFALFLLGLVLIGGIYFSSSITFPILELTNFAKKIANGDFNSVINVKTTDEIKILGDSFNLMSSEIQSLLQNKEELILKLEDYSKNLEQMVALRTSELKEANDFMGLMVNSLDQGLLVFDNELNCHPMFTQACEPIFGVSPLNKALPEVLGISGEENIQNLKQWAMVTFNELIPFESAIDLGPRNKTTGNNYNDANYKFVQIDYYPMRNDEENISNVVLIATDKTSEIQATEKAKEKEAYVTMILKILNNKTQFESFINEVEEILEQFHQAYSVKNATIEFDLVMMLFHTLNGGFGIYSMSQLQLMARDYETEISNIKDNCPDPLAYIPFLQNHVLTLKEVFLRFRKELDSLVGTKFAANISIAEIPRSKILDLKKLVSETHNKFLLTYFVDQFVKTSVYNYFKAYDELCKTTAVKIGKEFAGLTFHNANYLIEPEPFLEFFNVLIHLFRNCLDHGLEDPYTRKSLGKSPNGRIEVSFDEILINNKAFLSVRIQDDGAGIDPNIIRARFKQLNPNEDISHLSNEKVIYKIFDPFFSTRDEVSALSGRGVGMSAIKDVVDKLHGVIEIISTVGTGTLFSFILPFER